MKNKETKPVKWTLRKIKTLKRTDGLKLRRVASYTMRSVVECSTSRYAKRLALCTYQDDQSAITYSQLKRMAVNIGLYLLENGFVKGDKIAILGESSPLWLVFYLGMTSVGIIAVPVLPDFSSKDVDTIIKTSKVKAVAVNIKQFEKCIPLFEDSLRLIRLDDLFEIPVFMEKQLENKDQFASAPGNDLTRYKARKGWEKLYEENEPDEDDLASIIFTSGTTGKSKGVMLTHKNLVWNADICADKYTRIKPGYRALSILPLSHVYEFTTGQILMLLCGAEIHYLGRPPVPSIMMPALKKVRPQIMLTVPLLIEKVYKSAVKPVFENNMKLQFWLNWGPSRKFISRIVGRKLKLAFGGKLTFYGIGGAPLDKQVEKFLRDAKFPYAEGYGLTETSPMICGHGPKDHPLGVLGTIIEGESVRLDDINSEGVGEILVKGPNVMKGYYENDALNKECFTADGYFRTGDLGSFDKKGRLSLKGRTKTMILGSGGENIYPEIIESVINNQSFVTESLVVPEDGGLLALVKIDLESFAKNMAMNASDARAEAAKYLARIRQEVNKDLSSFSKISSMKLQEEPFERTPTLKIKRFLYGMKKTDDKKKEI